MKAGSAALEQVSSTLGIWLTGYFSATEKCMWGSAAEFKSGITERGRIWRRALTCRHLALPIAFFSRDTVVPSKRPMAGHNAKRLLAQELRHGFLMLEASLTSSMNAGSVFAVNHTHRRHILLGYALQCLISVATSACLPTVQRKDCMLLPFLNSPQQLQELYRMSWLKKLLPACGKRWSIILK